MATDADVESAIPLEQLKVEEQNRSLKSETILSIHKEPKRRETIKDNELSLDYIYSQKFVFAPSETAQFKSKVCKDYITPMVDKLDIFFKAQLYYPPDDDDGEMAGCVISFHLFCIEGYENEKNKVKINQSVQAFLEDFQTAQLSSSEVLIRKDTVLRKPVYIKNQDYPDNPVDCCTLPENCCWKCINWWLIVPRVQWDFFALLYQMYAFDICHQGFICKLVHFFTIPINVALSMMFLAQFKLGLDESVTYASEFVFDINASLILMLILVLLYTTMGLIRKCAVWGLATSLFVFLLWGAGNCMYTKFSYETKECYDHNSSELDTGPKWYNPVLTPYNPIMWSYIISFMQASSHMLVPQLPPFITGVTHWEAVSVFLCRQKGAKACCWKVLALACFPFTSVAVAWFSWPHLIGTEMFYIMAGIGYKHSYFKKYKLITQKAELSGDPNCSRFPDSYQDMTEASEISQYSKHHNKAKLESQGLLEKGKQYTPKQVFKELATLHIYQHYFHTRQKHALDSDSSDAHFMHYKMLSDNE